MPSTLSILIAIFSCLFLIHADVVLPNVDESTPATSALTFKPSPSPLNSHSASQTYNSALTFTTTTTQCTSETSSSQSYPNSASSPKSHYPHSTTTIMYTCDCGKNSTSTLPLTSQAYSANQTHNVILTYTTTTTRCTSPSSSSQSYPNSPLNTWIVYPNSIVTPVMSNATGTSSYPTGTPAASTTKSTFESYSAKLRVSDTMGWDKAVVIMGMAVLTGLI